MGTRWDCLEWGSWTPSRTKKQLAKLTPVHLAVAGKFPGGQSPALSAIIKGKGSSIICHPDTASSASMPGKEVCFAKFRSLERSAGCHVEEAAHLSGVTEATLLPGSWITPRQPSAPTCVESTCHVTVLRTGAIGVLVFSFVFLKLSELTVHLHHF